MVLSRYALAYLVALVVLAGFQLILGANVFLLSSLLIVSAAAVYPLSSRQMLVSDALYIGLCIYYGLGALVVKSLVLQPVQMNLQAPVASAAMLLIGFTSITVGYLASRWMYTPSPYFSKVRDLFASEKVESLIAKPVFILGTVFYALQTIFRAKSVNGVFEEGGFGGFGAFYPFLTLGVTLQAALFVQRSDKRLQGQWLLLMGAAMLALALAGNVKKTIFDFVLVMVIAYFSFGMVLRARYIAPLAATLLIVFLYISPAIHIVRTQTSLSSLERVEATWQLLVDYNFNPTLLAAEADHVASLYTFSFESSYIYPVPWNADRFTLISPIDQIVRSPRAGTIGLSYLPREIAESILPSFIISKQLITSPDRIAWHYGFRANGVIARPVVGLIASSIAAFGLLGAVLMPGIIIGFGFYILNRIGGRLLNNPWGVFLVVAATELVEKEATTFITFFTRSFLVDLATAAILLVLLRSRIERPRYPLPLSHR